MKCCAFAIISAAIFVVQISAATVPLSKFPSLEFNTNDLQDVSTRNLSLSRNLLNSIAAIFNNLIQQGVDAANNLRVQSEILFQKLANDIQEFIQMMNNSFNDYMESLQVELNDLIQNNLVSTCFQNKAEELNDIRVEMRINVTICANNSVARANEVRENIQAHNSAILSKLNNIRVLVQGCLTKPSIFEQLGCGFNIVKDVNMNIAQILSESANSIGETGIEMASIAQDNQKCVFASINKGRSDLDALMAGVSTCLQEEASSTMPSE